MIIRVPKAQGNGTPCRRIVEFVDIYPTVATAAGVDLPEGLAGRDLSPLLEDPLAAWNGEAITQVLRPADDRLETQVMGCSIRTSRYRYTEWAEGRSGVELYDHAADPMEFNNLAIGPDEKTRAVMKDLSIRLQRKASGKIPTVPVNPARL